MMFEALIRENRLMLEFEKFQLHAPEIHLIKEFIAGAKHKCPPGWKWTGVSKELEFLFQIVSNQRNGVDVDKFDYLLRDVQVLPAQSQFDPINLIQHSRVMLVSVLLWLSFPR